MGYRPDDQLSDGLLLAEIDLLTDVIIAASAASVEHFTTAEIDQVLGVVPVPRQSVRIPEQVVRDIVAPRPPTENAS